MRLNGWKGGDGMRLGYSRGILCCMGCSCCEGLCWQAMLEFYAIDPDLQADDFVVLWEAYWISSVEVSLLDLADFADELAFPPQIRYITFR